MKPPEPNTRPITHDRLEAFPWVAASAIFTVVAGVVVVGVAFGDLRASIKAQDDRMTREIEIRNQSDAALRARIDRVADVVITLMSRHDPSNRWIGELEGRE